MIKTVVGFAAGLALGVGGIAAAGPSIQNPENPPRWMSSPCKYEDSSNCFWDATIQGNGKGRSFYSIKVGKKDCVVYWHNKFAKKNNYCVKKR